MQQVWQKSLSLHNFRKLLGIIETLVLFFLKKSFICIFYLQCVCRHMHAIAGRTRKSQITVCSSQFSPTTWGLGWAWLGRLGSQHVQHVSVPVDQHPSSSPQVLLQKLQVSAPHPFLHFQGLYTNSHTTVPVVGQLGPFPQKFPPWTYSTHIKTIDTLLLF